MTCNLRTFRVYEIESRQRRHRKYVGGILRLSTGGIHFCVIW